jgi:hypothetical protein
MSALDEYAAEIVNRLPQPPRSVSTWALIKRMYRTQGARWSLGFALILGLPATFVFAFVAEGDLWLRVPVSLFLGAFTIFLFVLPAVGAIRLSRALVTGLRVEGEIVSAHWTAPGLRPATIEAGTYGMAIGTRRVFHPTGTFEEKFQSDSRWARELTAGLRIALLVDQTLPRVLFDLGPARGKHA